MKRIILIWLVLVLLTVIGFLGVENNLSRNATAILVMAIAAVKIHLVIGQFMEVKWKHRPLYPILQFWVLGCAVMILAGYFIAVRSIGF